MTDPVRHCQHPDCKIHTFHNTADLMWRRFDLRGFRHGEMIPVIEEKRKRSGVNGGWSGAGIGSPE